MSREIVSFDWAIKHILRDKANYVVLEGFLLALLGEEITIINILESEGNQETREIKYNRVDLIAENSIGEHIIVEIQYAPEKNYFKRLLFGASKDISDNIKSGEDYSHVKKVYSISIIYFDVEAHRPNSNIQGDYVYHGLTQFYGLHNRELVDIDSNYLVGYNNNGELINIFPEYFIISIPIFNNRVKDSLDEWIYSIKNSKVEDNFKSKGIKEMSEKLDYISMTPEEQRSYNKYLEDVASDRGALEFARDRGIAQGIEQGERQEQIKIAKKLLSEGSEISFVSKVTDLSIDELKELE